MNPLRISIVTVSYNQGKYIEDCILSVIEQQYPDIEHIIIDAGSTDDTIEILRKYDRYLRWISEPDDGQSHGLNKGFRCATGDVIGWINSDDKLERGSLYHVSSYFTDNPLEIAVVGDQRLIDENGDSVRIIHSRQYTYDYLLNHALGITQNSIFFKKSVFNMIGYIDQELHYAMDSDFFIRLARLQKIPYLPKILSQFRMQPYSKTAGGSYAFSRELVNIRKKYRGDMVGPASRNDYYVLLSEPFRRISLLRRFVRFLRSL